MSANDKQEGGSHYKDVGVQPWDVVDTWSKDQQVGAYRHSALKYIMRMGTKGDQTVEIKKTIHYLEKLLEVLNTDDQEEFDFNSDETLEPPSHIIRKIYSTEGFKDA